MRLTTPKTSAATAGARDVLRLEPQVHHDVYFLCFFFFFFLFHSTDFYLQNRLRDAGMTGARDASASRAPCIFIYLLCIYLGIIKRFMTGFLPVRKINN